MTTAQISCPKCKSWLSEGLYNQPDLLPCDSCGTLVRAEVFPAFFRPVETGRTGDAVLVDGESTCFFHPNKKAVLPCQSCGRFLCTLCDCSLHGEHFCPACLEAGRTKGKIKSLENRRTLYDSLALGLAVLPLLIFYFTLITAPMALYVAIRYWKAPLSVIHRTRIRFVIAIVLASLQIAAWLAGLVMILT